MQTYTQAHVRDKYCLYTSTSPLNMAGRIPCGHDGLVKGELCTEVSCVLGQDTKPIVPENPDSSLANIFEDVKPKLEHYENMLTKPVSSNYNPSGGDVKLSEIKSEAGLTLIKDNKPELKQENFSICSQIEKEHNYHKMLRDVIKEEMKEDTETHAHIEHDETETDDQVLGEYYMYTICVCDLCFYIILYRLFIIILYRYSKVNQLCWLTHWYSLDYFLICAGFFLHSLVPERLSAAQSFHGRKALYTP